MTVFRLIVVAALALVTLPATLDDGSLSVAFAAGVVVASEDLDATAATLTTCTLTASADAELRERNPNNNYGTIQNIRVDPRNTRVRRNVTIFPVASCSIPATADVLSARLEIWQDNAPNNDRTHGAHLVTSAWTETTVTWNTQPTTAATPTATALTGTVINTWVAWELTNDVELWIGGSTNNGWLVKDENEGGGAGNLTRYRSSEYTDTTKRPTLVIRWIP